MIEMNRDLDPQLADLFEALRAAPQRDAQRAAAGRAKFLSQARALSPAAAPQAQAQAGRILPALPRWVKNNFHPAQRSPAWRPSIALGTLLAVLVLLAISSGTVYAAQYSLPDQPLYGLKLWSERLRLAWSPTPAAQLAAVLDFSDRRLHEIEALQASGQPIPVQVLDSYQGNLETCLDLAASLEPARTGAALQAIALRTRTQERVLRQMGSNPANQRLLQQARTAAEETAGLAELGLSQPADFRRRLEQRRSGVPEKPASAPADAPEAPGAATEPVPQAEVLPAAPQVCADPCTPVNILAVPRQPVLGPLRRMPFGDPPQELLPWDPGAPPLPGLSREGTGPKPVIPLRPPLRGATSGPGAGEFHLPLPRGERPGPSGGMRRP